MDSKKAAMRPGSADGGDGDEHGADATAHKEALQILTGGLPVQARGDTAGAASSTTGKRSIDTACLYKHGRCTSESESEVEVKIQTLLT